MSDTITGAPPTPGQVGICIDLDGVLVTTPVMLMVASAVDLVEEVDVLTRATESGELPFARSVRLRCRILDEVPVSEARRRAAVTTFDPDVAAVVRAKAGRCHLVTALPDCWVDGVADGLSADVVASPARVEGDRLVEVVDVVDKGDVVRDLKDRYDLVVGVGSGANDLSMLEAADVAVVYGPQPPPLLRQQADYWVTSGRGLWELLRPL